MSTTSKFQAYKDSHIPADADVTVKPRYDIKTGKLDGPSLQDQYDNGKVPKSLKGKVILKREHDATTGHVIGWHWIEPKAFNKRYTTTRRLAGLLNKDIYYQSWKKQGLV